MPQKKCHDIKNDAPLGVTHHSISVSQVDLFAQTEDVINDFSNISDGNLTIIIKVGACKVDTTGAR